MVSIYIPTKRWTEGMENTIVGEREKNDCFHDYNGTEEEKGWRESVDGDRVLEG